MEEKIIAEPDKEPDKSELRKFDRRTWRDRRRVWKNKNYKGPERRKTRKRRCSFDRRGVPIPDELGKNIP
ncbi:MAG: hypothetical protein Q7U10_08330 [Thermodesulfovibrionia bacterium]|nr:hypothetical protein [Thermodesulfovibrionia bacterium]